MRSVSRWPELSNRHSSTLVAFAENKVKFVPRPSQIVRADAVNPPGGIAAVAFYSSVIPDPAKPKLRSRASDSERAKREKYAPQKRRNCIPAMLQVCSPFRAARRWNPHYRATASNRGEAMTRAETLLTTTASRRFLLLHAGRDSYRRNEPPPRPRRFCSRGPD